MSIEELNVFITEQFPQVEDMFTLDSLEPMKLSLRMRVDDTHLRPGGTISGPSMFTLADVAIYLVTLSMVGPKALAVTTSCSMDFMRRPKSGVDLVCETELLKLGRVLAVGSALIRSGDDPRPVARASMTYSIPRD